MQSVLRKVAGKVPKLNPVSSGSLKLPCILAYADDLLILAEKREDLESIIKAIEECLGEVGLEINNSKSQILVRNPNKAEDKQEEMILNGKNYRICEIVKYLGIFLTSKLNRRATTRQRCINATKASKVVVDFCRKFKPPWDIGKLIYKTVIAPAMTYGTKVATLTKRNRLQLSRYEKMIIKDIWRHCRKERKRKINVRKELTGRTINRRIRVGRIKYYGHIMRRESNHPLKLAYKLKFKKKKKGRPSFTWKKSLKMDLQRYDININWQQLAKDKEKLKRKAEEIYKNESSEISDGDCETDESDEENN